MLFDVPCSPLSTSTGNGPVSRNAMTIQQTVKRNSGSVRFTNGRNSSIEPSRLGRGNGNSPRGRQSQRAAFQRLTIRPRRSRSLARWNRPDRDRTSLRRRPRRTTRTVSRPCGSPEGSTAAARGASTTVAQLAGRGSLRGTLRVPSITGRRKAGDFEFARSPAGHSRARGREAADRPLEPKAHTPPAQTTTHPPPVPVPVAFPRLDRQQGDRPTAFHVTSDGRSPPVPDLSQTWHNHPGRAARRARLPALRASRRGSQLIVTSKNHRQAPGLRGATRQWLQIGAT